MPSLAKIVGENDLRRRHIWPDVNSVSGRKSDGIQIDRHRIIARNGPSEAAIGRNVHFIVAAGDHFVAHFQPFKSIHIVGNLEICAVQREIVKRSKARVEDPILAQRQKTDDGNARNFTNATSVLLSVDSSRW